MKYEIKFTAFTNPKMKPFTEYRTMIELAVQALRLGILTGVYTPGTQLVPLKLEKELNLSRVAIREALWELSGSGLVISKPNKGQIVADAPTWDEIEAIYEARYILEGQAAYWAALRMTSDKLEKMRQLNALLAAESISPQEYFIIDREFHQTLYQTSGWKCVSQLANKLADQILLFRSYHKIVHQFDYKLWIQDHAYLIEALESGNAEEAKRLLVAHLRGALDQVRKAYYEMKPS